MHVRYDLPGSTVAFEGEERGVAEVTSGVLYIRGGGEEIDRARVRHYRPFQMHSLRSESSRQGERPSAELLAGRGEFDPALTAFEQDADLGRRGS